VSLESQLAEVVTSAVRAAIDRELAARLGDDRVTINPPPDDRPLDAKALQERGYSTAEAYALLNAHGQRLPGGRRARIAKSVLDRVERGELSPEIHQARTTRAGKGAAAH